jgi:hypothetical protein
MEPYPESGKHNDKEMISERPGTWTDLQTRHRTGIIVKLAG